MNYLSGIPCAFALENFTNKFIILVHHTKFTFHGFNTAAVASKSILELINVII